MKKVFLGILLTLFILGGGKATFSYFQTRSVSPNGDYIVRYKIEEGWWKKPTICKVMAKYKGSSGYVENEVWTSKIDIMDVSTEWLDKSHCKLGLFLDGYFERGVLITFDNEQILFQSLKQWEDDITACALTEFEG